MRKLRHALAALALVTGMMALTSSSYADPVVCHEYSCCSDVVVLGKTILNIDC